MSETVYLESPFARISNAWFVFRDRAYRVQDINSVTTRTLGSNRGLLLVAGYLPAAVMLLVSMFSRRDANTASGLSEIPVVGGCMFIISGCNYILSVLLALAVIYWLYSLVTTPRSLVYLIALHGTFGKSTAFALLDRSTTERIAEAMNKALASKIPAEGQPAPLLDRGEQADPGQSSLEGTSLTDGVVSVTQWEVKVDKRSYPRPSIKSARLSEVQIDSVSDLLDMAMFLGLLFMAINRFYEWLVDNPTGPNHVLFTTFAVVGMLLWTIAFLIKNRRKAAKAHVVELHGTFGRVNAFVTLDEAYAKKIVDAIKPPRKRRASGRSTNSGAVSN
jgi:hypothetical protein